MKPRMHRSNELRSSQESAGLTSRRARTLVRAALPLLRQRRHAPVRRIDDQRRAPRLDHVGAAVHPEVVVGADAAARLGAAGRRLPELDVAGHGRLLAARRLFLGQELLITELLGPLQRRDRAEVPDPLQIRRAPRRPGRLVLPDRRRRQQGHQRQRRQHGYETSSSHLNLPGSGHALARPHRFRPSVRIHVTIADPRGPRNIRAATRPFPRIQLFRHAARPLDWKLII